MAKLKPLKFKNYTWPHNPTTYSVNYDKNVVIHEFPGVNAAEIEVINNKSKIIRGNGEFFGKNAYSQFKKLEKIYKENTPGRLVHPIWASFDAVFNNLSLTQEPRANYVAYSFEFIEHKSISKVQKVRKVAKPSPPAKPSTRTYVVKKGDNLWNIAKKYYGRGIEYKRIANANKKLIKNPNLIYPGWKLIIP